MFSSTCTFQGPTVVQKLRPFNFVTHNNKFSTSADCPSTCQTQPKMASTQAPIVLVTGANRGIGFSTVQSLSLRFPSGTYIIGSRTLSSGHEAIQALQKLCANTKLEVVELDVTNDSTIDAAVGFIRKKFGRLDGTIFPKLVQFPTDFVHQYS